MTQENQNLDVIPFPQPAQSFKDAIEALEKKHTGAHNALHEALRDIYAIYLAEIVGVSGKKLAENQSTLNTACEIKKIKTSDQTTDLHKLVKLIVTVNPQLASGYVHVLSVAHALSKTSDQFLDWLKNAGGIEAVRKKFLANGDDNPNYESGSKREKKRAENVANARDGLQSARCTIDASALASANFDRVAAPKECVAIVVRYPNGSIGIKDFVSDDALLDATYLQHAAEQKAKSHTDKTSAATPPTSQEREAAVAELAGVGAA
jgi:hypothetical protein